MGRVAVYAFVQNEADDIAWWIAHYVGLGASTLVIYDRASTDGTWKALQAAQAAGFVTARRIDPSFSPFECSEFAVQDIVANIDPEVDWIAQVNIDEYIVFDDPSESLDLALDEYMQADGVALSLCVFGSGDALRPPRISPLLAYPRHAPAFFNGHETAVTFWRPAILQANPAPVKDYAGGDRCMMISGTSAVVHPDGRIQPNWHRARVRKYACRSMAQFIERTRTAAQEGLAEWWRLHDRNDEQAPRPELPRDTGRIVSRIYRQQWRHAILGQQMATNRAPGFEDDFKPDHGEAAEAFVVVGERGVAAYDVKRRCLRALPVDVFEAHSEIHEDFELVYAFRWRHVPDWVVLVRPIDGQADDLFHQGELGLLCGLMPLRVEAVSDHRVALKSPLNDRYMTLIPFSHEVTLDREEIQDWERHTLRPVERPPASARLRVGGVGALTSRNLTAVGVMSALGRLAFEQGEALACVFSMLPLSEQRLMAGHFPAWLTRGPV